MSDSKSLFFLTLSIACVHLYLSLSLSLSLSLTLAFVLLSSHLLVASAAQGEDAVRLRLTKPLVCEIRNRLSMWVSRLGWSGWGLTYRVLR